MANCIDCGTRIGFTNNGSDGRCSLCTVKNAAATRPAEDWGTQNRLADKDRLALIESILLTTETTTNLHIIKRIEIVTAECAYGMNAFKDLFAAVRNVVGGRSEAVQSTMRDARKTALYELKREAYLVGANAVVGVDLDYVEVGSAGANMIMLVASGTAVVIEENG
jgi:uncharacterized protein YbjQ (UPF0145 family)